MMIITTIMLLLCIKIKKYYFLNNLFLLKIEPFNLNITSVFKKILLLFYHFLSFQYSNNTNTQLHSNHLYHFFNLFSQTIQGIYFILFVPNPNS